MGAMILTMASDWRPFRATSLLFWRSIAARGGGKYLAICEQGRASNPVLFDENRKTVTVNRLDHIIGRAQFKTHGLIVHDRYHDHGDRCQTRICFKLIQNRPTIAVRHNHIQSYDQWVHLLGKPQTFFATGGSDYMKP